MAEEHHCEAPEGHHLCANNCGFFGSPATMNLCSKCYRDFRLKEEQATSAKSAVEKSLAAIPPPTAGAGASSTSAAVANIPAVIPPAAVQSAAAAGEPQPATHPSRCASCRKRVGLTGFRCRCGTTFCNAHRYPEQHGCTFDFKAAGRAAIAMANPVVKAEKLDKI